MTMRSIATLVGALAVGLAVPGAAAAGEAEGVPTYAKDVAPIIFDNCLSCHRPDQVAPMSFRDYKETRPWARAIKEKVQSREMPPWFADPQYGAWLNDRRLSQAQVDTIVAWVDGGSKIMTVGHFDNSLKNRYNPAPDLEVYWAEQSWDEMFNGFYEYSVDETDAKPTTN